MGALVDMTGRRVGRLLVLYRDSETQRTSWICLCDCKNVLSVLAASLRSSATKSCGCLRRETTSRRRRSHGESHVPEHVAWYDMLQRCYNAHNKAYSRYGGRGIGVCDRWRQSYDAFLYDMGRRPSTRHSLERKDVNGQYGPDNCVWALPVEQANNRRDNRLLTARGVTRTVAQWCRDLDLDHEMVRGRLRYGWTDEEVLFRPRRPRRRIVRA